MIRTDFHSHILPRMDDGSGNVEESLAMLRMEAEQGIRQVVATPHFNARYDDPAHFLSRRAAAAQQLREAASQQEDLPRILLGAEVHYFQGISDSEVLRSLTIDGTNCVLIEMPPAPWTEQMYRELEWIHAKQGLIPVIAHIDRYVGPIKNHGILRRLQTLPVLVQANASFFLKWTTAPYGLRLLRQKRIHLLGSDCHNMTDRAPNLGAAAQRIDQACGAAALERICRQEQRVLQEI